MRRLFELMEVTPEHVLVIVTHTALYTDEVQGAYSDALHRQLGGEVVSRENIVHANFAQWAELRQASREPNSPIPPPASLAIRGLEPRPLCHNTVGTCLLTAHFRFSSTCRSPSGRTSRTPSTTSS